MSESDADFETINRYLRTVLNNDGRKRNSMNPELHEGIMIAAVEQLIEAMKEECPLFNYLYKENIYTGSYYEKLRVSDSNEFDLNLVLQLPIPRKNIILIEDDDHPTYVTVQITGNSRKKAFLLECRYLDPHPISLFTNSGQLSRCHIQEWMNKVIGNAIANQIWWPEGVIKVSYDLHGPAFMLTIQTIFDTIYVDLVTVIDETNIPLPFQLRKTELNNELSDKAWQYFLVPKPIHHPPSRECDHLCGLWRISFPEAEKELLYNKGCVKPLIRIFKILRNSYQWNELYSYFIKATFINQLEKDPYCEDWDEQDIGCLFLKMLKVFAKTLSKRHPFIEHYFIANANVFGEMDIRGAKKIAFEMRSLRRDILFDPEILRQIFTF